MNKTQFIDFSLNERNNIFLHLVQISGKGFDGVLFVIFSDHIG